MGNAIDEYLKLRKKRLAGQTETKKDTGYAGFKQSQGSSVSSDNDEDLGPVKEEKRTWFSSGAFSDGYDFGDVTKTILGTAKDIGTDLTAGVLGIGESTIDAGAYLVGGAAKLFGADEFAEKTKKFIAADIIDEEALAPYIFSPASALGDITNRIVTGNLPKMDSFYNVNPAKDADEDYAPWYEDNSVLGDKSDSLAQSGGQLMGQIGLQAVGVPWYVTAGVTSFGGEAENAFKQGATYAEAGASAVIAAGAEILTEKLFGGSGLGEKGLINTSVLTKGISNKVVKALADFGVDMAAEGSEEVISQIFGNLGSSLYRLDNESFVEILASEEAFDGYLESFIGGAVLGGVANTGNVARSAKNKTDYRTGLDANEQKVVDTEIQRRMDETLSEKGEGGKLTNKEKSKIEQEVLRDLERGALSADSIERTLFGEDVDAYNAKVMEEQNILNEYNELSDIKKSDLTTRQEKRLAELETTIQEVQEGRASGELRAKLDEKLGSILAVNGRDSKLKNSYVQTAKRGKKFTVDLTQVDEKYRETYKTAMESGVWNDTTDSHHAVDALAKISSKRGVKFDFTSDRIMLNEEIANYTAEEQKIIRAAIEGDNGLLQNLSEKKLPEYITKFAGDNADTAALLRDFAAKAKAVKQKNAWISEDRKTITYKVGSIKGWRSTVGHEIGHTIEKTKHYKVMKEALYKVAESRGELDSRRESVKDLYGDGNGDIEIELTNDLLGDYIFSGEEFARELYKTDRNAFQRIFDEIKHWLKLVSPGSKEAKQLEIAKRNFEKAMQEVSEGDTKASENTGTGDGVAMSLAGVDENGVEVYETSEDTKKLSYAERKSKLLNIMEKEYAGRTAKFTKNGETYYAFYSKKGLNKGLYGDLKSDQKGYKAKINVGADGNYVELAENALYSGSSAENEKTNKFHNDAQTWDYYVKTIKSDGNYFDVLINVKNTDSDQFVYDITLKKSQHYRHDTQKVSYVGNSVSSYDEVSSAYSPDIGPVKSADNVSNESISQNGENVNTNSKNPESFSFSEPEQPISLGQFRDSLSKEGEMPRLYGNDVRGTDILYMDDIAPVRDGVAPVGVSEVESATEDLAPLAEEVIEPVMEKATKTAQAVSEDIGPTYETAEGQISALPVGEKEAAEPKATRKRLHAKIVDGIKSIFAENGLDFDKVLKKAKNLSTFSTVDNTPQRVMEKALGYKEGQILSDLTVNKVAQNETEGVKWLHAYTDRKNGIIAQISKKYHIKPRSKQSAAAQMYAEGFYVGKNNDIVTYGDAELAQDFPDVNVQNNIKGLARDPMIRQIYDDTLARINESRTRNAYPEIPRLDNYYLHFRAMNDTFSRLGLPFNPNDIKAKDLPTDLNGVTADLKPGQPYFASAQHRTGKRTEFDLLGGLEQYLTGAKNQIYHIDDIQTLRALRNYIADTYGQVNGLDGLDALSEEEAQERVKEVYNSHLSTFAKFLNEEANILAGKTALIDRGLEGIIGRRGMTFLDTVNKQVGSNMVGHNISSSLTNFLPVAQTFAKTNKAAFVKAFGQTVANRIGHIFGRGDTFSEDSPVMIRRRGADRYSRTAWQKASDAGYALMGAVDSVSTELIARTKYNEMIKKGMDSKQAHIETDKWVSRLMGDRSLGQMPQLYNSKMLGLVTKFQLEVRNQLDSQFYDTIKEVKAANEDIDNALERNAKTAAKVASVFVQLAIAQHLFGVAFESVAGYNPAFDIIEAIAKAIGWDDEEDSEDTRLDNIEQGLLTLLEDLPYTSTFTGGRVPISSALPIEELVTGTDQYGNEKSRFETIFEAAPYYILPGGYGQAKKTVQGLSMFDDNLPISGSYTDSGKLRYPVDKTLGNVAQAAIFGQYASENAREYFDRGRSALTAKQTQELVETGMSIQEYWTYRDGLKGLDTMQEKYDYIDSLNLSSEQKNILVNNLSSRKEEVDISDYGKYENYGKFMFAQENPEKHEFLEAIGISYEQYMATDESKEAYTWAYNNPEKYTLSKAISGDLLTYYGYRGELYNIKADKDEDGKAISGSRKEKVINYINSLDADYGEKIILYKSEYNADDTYNHEIIDYLNSRDDISYSEMVIILKELGFNVDADGNIYWD